jgi:hypothetical protein
MATASALNFDSSINDAYGSIYVGNRHVISRVIQDDVHHHLDFFRETIDFIRRGLQVNDVEKQCKIQHL